MSISNFTSRGLFFSACVVLIAVWALSYFAFPEPDTWQLVINTATTIITFLLVALLQNSQRRGEAAIQAKLDALADALADLMEYHLEHDDVDLKGDVDDLKQAVGLEQVGARDKAAGCQAQLSAVDAAAEDEYLDTTRRIEPMA